jgi:hypothetical protein
MTASMIVERDGGRVVLKALEEDCLLDGEVHPSIQLRLNRVRELPMTAVANLHGVEVVDGRAVMVWEFVEGRTVEELLPGMSPERRARLRDELRLVVERMHGLGIVHGGLHRRNVIVDARGRVRVTHVSALLHSDGEVDRDAVERIFVEATPASRQGGAANSSTLRVDRDAGVASTEEEMIRRRALVGAVVALVAGVIIAASILWYSSSHS